SWRKRYSPPQDIPSIGIHFVLALKPGRGKQMIKKGIQRNTKSSKATMIINKSRAHMVMIGIEREQIMPIGVAPDLQGAISPTERSWCNGQGSTERTRSPNVIPFIR